MTSIRHDFTTGPTHDIHTTHVDVVSENCARVDGRILGDPGADNGGERKSKRAGKYGPFRLSFAPTICPWVSEDGMVETHSELMMYANRAL